VADDDLNLPPMPGMGEEGGQKQDDPGLPSMDLPSFDMPSPGGAMPDPGGAPAADPAGSSVPSMDAFPPLSPAFGGISEPALTGPSAALASPLRCDKSLFGHLNNGIFHVL